MSRDAKTTDGDNGGGDDDSEDDDGDDDSAVLVGVGFEVLEMHTLPQSTAPKGRLHCTVTNYIVIQCTVTLHCTATLYFNTLQCKTAL